MAVSVRNLKKYVKDHPELGDKGAEILARLEGFEERSVLNGSHAKRIINDPQTASLFFEEILTRPEHVQMGLADIAAAAQK